MSIGKARFIRVERLLGLKLMVTLLSKLFRPRLGLESVFKGVFKAKSS